MLPLAQKTHPSSSLSPDRRPFFGSAPSLLLLSDARTWAKENFIPILIVIRGKCSMRGGRAEQSGLASPVRTHRHSPAPHTSRSAHASVSHSPKLGLCSERIRSPFEEAKMRYMCLVCRLRSTAASLFPALTQARFLCRSLVASPTLLCAFAFW